MINKSLKLLSLVAALVGKSLLAAPDMIIHNAKVTTYDGTIATAFSVVDGKIEQLTADSQLLIKQKGVHTRVIDAQGSRVIPGINDSHLHVVRGGRFYNLETRWEGISSLKKALNLIKEQALRTPKGQWVRVIGGWSPYQFSEKRMPTPEELTQAAPTTPVFVLHLYSGGVLNQKALQVLGIDKNTEAPKGSRYEKDSEGNPTGVLVAEPNPMILYKTIAALPHMNEQQQLNSSQQFFRKLLSLGITSVVDTGGGGHKFPDDYQASTTLAVSGRLPLRISNYLFPQQPGQELNHFIQWMSNNKLNQNMHLKMTNGYVTEGGGELLSWKASDYENFKADRPELDVDAEKELEQIIRLHLLQGWPFRLHATYDQSIGRILNLLEEINQTQSLNNVRWIIDHAETVTERNLHRIKNLGGAIAVQGRMAFAGEDFIFRYGKKQAKHTPPIKKMIQLGIPVGLGTDGTRVASFNPWATYYWAVTGKTVGGTQLYDKDNRLDRLTALKLFTSGSAYFSGEENVKGQLKSGMYADFAILNQDILTVKEERLLNTRSTLTVVAGEIRYAAKDSFPMFHSRQKKAIPAWSPVNYTKKY